MVKKLILAAAAGVAFAGLGAVQRPSIVPQWQGAEVGKWTMDYTNALDQAKAEGKWTLVLFTGSWWCPWCQPLEQKVLDTKAWADYAEARGFYEAEMDFPNRAGTGNFCWLWDTQYQSVNGLNPTNAAAALVDRLHFQDKHSEKGGTARHASNMCVSMEYETSTTNCWTVYEPEPVTDYTGIGYPTIVVFAPDGKAVGRFEPNVRDNDPQLPAEKRRLWSPEEAFVEVTNGIEKVIGGRSYVRVSVADDCTAYGSVTKVDKVFAKGAAVTLKATAKSGYVFAGWFAGGHPLDLSFDYRTASTSFKADGKDRLITARFVSKTDDKAGISIACTPEAGYSVTNAMSLVVAITSGSKPTVTAKPLPAGLKLVAPSAANGWNAVISGTPTKPSQEVTTTITVKNASATSSKNIVLRIWDKRSDLLPELRYDEGYTFIPGDKPDMADVLGEATMAEITTNTNWSVSGLPDGLKFDAKKREFTGAPTKASKSYIVTFTLKSGKTTVDYATVVFRTTAFPETKLEAWFDYLGQEMDEISTNGVKLTGGKACAANTKLSLSATAPKAEKNKDSWVFAGWYAEKGADDSRLWNGTQDWRQASKYTFTSLTNDLTVLYARFVPKSKDGEVSIDCVPDPYYYKKTDMSLAVDVTSYSKPTVTVKPLPKGMKFNANTLRVTGEPTKDGEEQTAIITVKNVSGAKATMSVILKVKDIEAVTGLKDLKYNTGYTFIPGDKDLEAVIGSTLLNELGLGGWTLSGLPAGMKWDAKNNKITGAATKALTSYTVTFTKKEGSAVVDKATVTFRTSAFPETKLEPWFDYLDQKLDEISTNGVKLTGGKACAAGTVLKLTAKAPKAVTARGDEWVFAGWYSEKDTDCALDNGKQDWRLASSYQFTSLTNELTVLYARFVPKSLDGAVEIVCADGYDFTANVQTSVCVRVDSYSKPTVTATPLPKGMKWDANALAFSGKPTTPGDSKTCVIKAYNATVGKSAAETRTVSLHILDARSPNLPMLEYDKGYDFIPGDTDLKAVLGSELLNELGLGGWTVSGLPAGMKWDSKKNKITGAATKALASYTVTFTSKTNKTDKATVSFRTTAFPETRLEPWFDYQGVSEDEISTNGVKLTGGKACAANTKLSLSATAPKKATGATDQWVFAGWYSATNETAMLDNKTQDWRTASKYTFVSLTNELTVLYARFVPKSLDAANITLVCEASEDPYDPNTNMAPFQVDVTSDTLVKSITWSGYPKGMSFAQDKPTVLGGIVSGKPTEPGVYQTTFKVTNQSGSQSFPLTLKVKNIFNEELDALLDDGLKDSYTGFIPGVSPEDDLTFINLNGTGWKVSNLPGSMKLVNGLFTGAPDKPGEYTVWFKKYSGSKVVATATATFVVGPYPVLKLEPLVLDEEEQPIDPAPSGFTLTGGGEFAANTTPPVSASTTNPDYVFMGWFDSETNRIVSTASDYRNPTKFPCPVGSNPTNVVYGIFAPRSADWLVWNEINFTAIEFLVNKDASEGENMAIVTALDAGSFPTVVATGLPAGLKIDPKTLLFTGKPTKKGMYEVKLEISTASGFTYTTWIFVDVVSELMTFDDPGYPMHVVEGDEDPWWFGIDPMTFSVVFVGEYYGEEELYLGMTQQDKDGKVVYGALTAPKNLPTGLSAYHTVTNLEGGVKLWDWYLKGQITQVQKVGNITCTGVNIDGTNMSSKVVAYFRDSPAYWLTVVSGVGGQAVGGNLVAKPGRKTKVSAVPDEGYEFAGWYLDSEGKQPVDIPGSSFNFKKATAQEFVIPAGARDGNPVIWHALFRLKD